MTVRHVVFNFRPWGYPKACFKRCATAVLTWLDCSSTAARHQHDLVSNVEFNSVEQNGCYRKQNAKIKKRFSKLLNVFLSIFNLSIEFGTAVVRRLKPSRVTAVQHGKACRATRSTRQQHDLLSNVALYCPAKVEFNSINLVRHGSSTSFETGLSQSQERGI